MTWIYPNQRDADHFAVLDLAAVGTVKIAWRDSFVEDRQADPETGSKGTVAFTDGELGQAVLMRRRHSGLPVPRSSFAGFRFPPEVITVAVRRYLRYGLSYRDVEELLAERASRSTTSRFIAGCSGSPHC